MMAEIVHHGDAAGDTAHLLAAADALEAGQAGADRVVAETGMPRRADAHGRVAHVELADHRQGERHAVDFEARAVGAGLGDADALAAARPGADGLHRRAALERQAVGVVAVEQHQAVARHAVEQALEGQQNLAEIAENVGVVELDVVDDHALGQVVQELRALVEVGGVVLVPLDDKQVAVGEAGARFEVFRHAADHEPRVASRVFENPGQQGGGGGLAVSAADHEAALALDDLALEQLRHRHVGPLALQQGLQFLVAARDGVADDVEVGGRRQRFGAVALRHRDAGLAQHVRHRRIHLLIRPRNRVAEGAQGDGGGAHGRAADADEMEMFGRGRHGRTRAAPDRRRAAD